MHWTQIRTGFDSSAWVPTWAYTFESGPAGQPVLLGLDSPTGSGFGRLEEAKR
jgi:hypothetical protein